MKGNENMCDKKFYKSFITAAMTFAKCMKDKDEKTCSSCVYGISKKFQGKTVHFITHPYEKIINVNINEFAISFSFPFDITKVELENMLKEVFKKKYVKLQNQIKFIENIL